MKKSRSESGAIEPALSASRARAVGESLAMALGAEWQVIDLTPDDDRATLRGPRGEEIRIRPEKGRWAIDGLSPEYRDQPMSLRMVREPLSIRVNPARSIASIVGDIRRRLVPKYLEQFEQYLAICGEWEERDRARDALGHELATLCGGSFDTTRMVVSVESRSEEWTGLARFKFESGGLVTFEVRHATPRVVLPLARALGRAETTARTEQPSEVAPAPDTAQGHESRQYKVRWEIDLDADRNATPAAVAARALQLIQDASSIAHVFTVEDRNTVTTVDLDEGTTEVATERFQTVCAACGADGTLVVTSTVLTGAMRLRSNGFDVLEHQESDQEWVKCTACGDERELVEYVVDPPPGDDDNDGDDDDDGSVGSARVEFFRNET